MTAENDRDWSQDLDKVRWPIRFGNIKVQLREGKVTLIEVAYTEKRD